MNGIRLFYFIVEIYSIKNIISFIISNVVIKYMFEEKISFLDYVMNVSTLVPTTHSTSAV